MDVLILCSEDSHPINDRLLNFCQRNRVNHNVRIIRAAKEITNADILFLVSCHELIQSEDRQRFQRVFVLHASDLPKGRGWSPHIWQILEGNTEVVVTLLEAEDGVDTGQIWAQSLVSIAKTALYDAINDAIFDAEIELMQTVMDSYENIEPRPQSAEIEPSYYRKRSPQDSKVDTDQSIKDQFDLIRVCDPNRYPAFFEMHGETYKLVIEKYSDE